MKEINISELTENSSTATNRILKTAKRRASKLFPKSRKLDHAFHISPIVKMLLLYLHYCKKTNRKVTTYRIRPDLNNSEIVNQVFKNIDEELGISKDGVHYSSKNIVHEGQISRSDLKVSLFLKKYTKYENDSIVLNELGEMSYNQIIDASKCLINTC